MATNFFTVAILLFVMMMIMMTRLRSVPLSSPVTDNHLKLPEVSLPLRPGANVSRLVRRPLWQRPLSL